MPLPNWSNANCEEGTTHESVLPNTKDLDVMSVAKHQESSVSEVGQTVWNRMEPDWKPVLLLWAQHVLLSIGSLGQFLGHKDSTPECTNSNSKIFCWIAGQHESIIEQKVVICGWQCMLCSPHLPNLEFRPADQAWNEKNGTVLINKHTVPVAAYELM